MLSISFLLEKSNRVEQYKKDDPNLFLIAGFLKER